MIQLLYVILAAFGLGILVFIHELGHYFMARRVGMKVEAFGIGFGKPILSWEHQGVKWNICILPFGGYVRIAGMEKTGNLEPYEIPDGFYGRKPIDRIKVAIMGPAVNIAFAFLAFTVIWAAGGRQKPFSEYTHLMGWVDSHSTLYEAGVRPGDEIDAVDNRPIKGFIDLKYAVLLGEKTPQIKGFEIDYCSGLKAPFTYRFDSADVKGLERSQFMNWILAPADFAIYKRYPNGAENPLYDGSPLANSGIQYNDRIVWVDGEWVFSKYQLMQLINLPRVLLTIKRGDDVLLTRIPRMRVSDLRLTPSAKAELDDWQHDAGLKTKVPQLYYLPYSLDRNGLVIGPLNYINENVEETYHIQPPRSSLEIPLQPGDKIIAVEGTPVNSSVEVLSQLQTKKLHIIVQRSDMPSLTWQDADNYFTSSIPVADLIKMTSSIGTNEPIKNIGNLYMLNPVTPKPYSDFPLTEEQKETRSELLAAQKKQIDEIKDPKERANQLKLLEDAEKRLMLGINLQDLSVSYNPSPFTLFGDVLIETYRTLISLVTGYLNPKWLSGPVGIVQVIHYGWTVGVKEALFWMAVISMNLGLLNLLPLPVLDGGHICFSVVESVTKKPIKSKTMEKLIIPFVVLLVALFIYLTYNDLIRLFHRFF